MNYEKIFISDIVILNAPECLKLGNLQGTRVGYYIESENPPKPSLRYKTSQFPVEGRVDIFCLPGPLVILYGP